MDKTDTVAGTVRRTVADDSELEELLRKIREGSDAEALRLLKEKLRKERLDKNGKLIHAVADHPQVAYKPWMNQ